jgi:hypothetical protein
MLELNLQGSLTDGRLLHLCIWSTNTMSITEAHVIPPLHLQMNAKFLSDIIWGNSTMYWRYSGQFRLIQEITQPPIQSRSEPSMHVANAQKSCVAYTVGLARLTSKIWLEKRSCQMRLCDYRCLRHCLAYIKWVFEHKDSKHEAYPITRSRNILEPNH